MTVTNSTQKKPLTSVSSARIEAGKTQEEAASYLGISLPTYIKLERNPGEMTKNDAVALAEFFGSNIDAIFFG